MDKQAFSKHIEDLYTNKTLPALQNFIRIPNLSPNLDKNWKQNGLLRMAANSIISFGQSLQLNEAQFSYLEEKNFSPFVCAEIKETRKDDDRIIILYGHFDKQVHGQGWDQDKGPTKPVIQNGKLYGRGSADDGYACFSILTIIKALEDFNYLHPKIVCLFDGAKESGVDAFKYYLNKMKEKITNPKLFIPIDLECTDYTKYWITKTAKEIDERTKKICDKSSKTFFENEAGYIEAGESIPYIAYIIEAFPECEIVACGICGKDSCKHGPNENVDIAANKKLIGVLGNLLSDY